MGTIFRDLIAALCLQSLMRRVAINMIEEYGNSCILILLLKDLAILYEY